MGKANETKKTVYSIDLEAALKNTRQMKLSDIAEGLEYMELETPPELPIMVIHIAVSKDYIFINSKGAIYKFTISGDYMRPVGRLGRGPGEYISGGSIFVNEESQTVAVISAEKLYSYTFDGDFIGTSDIGLYNDVLVADTLIYGSFVPFGQQKYKLTVMNGQLDTLGGIPNHNIYDTKGISMWSSMRFRDPFYTYNGDVYFKGYRDNDTVWRMDGGQYDTHAMIDMGKFKYPEPSNVDEMMAHMGDFDDKRGDYYMVNRAFEDDRYIYLDVEPYYNPDMGSPRIVFDKESMTGITAKDNSGDYGFEDDILGGPAFWPQIITDEYYISVIEPYKLVDNTENTDPSPALKDFLKSIDAEKSNTIIILAKRKTN